MKKNVFRTLAAVLLAGLVAVPMFSGCSVEKPDWLVQATCEHEFEKTKTLKEATCGEEGKEKQTCTECGKEKTVVVKATGEHAWDGGVTADGMTTFTCTVCGSIETQSKAPAACLHENYDQYGDTMRMNTCLDCGTYIPDLPTSAVSVGDTVGGWYKFYLDSDTRFIGEFEIGFDWVEETGLIDATDVRMTVDYVSAYGATFFINGFTTQSGYNFAMGSTIPVGFNNFHVDDNSIYIFIDKFELLEYLDYYNGETHSSIQVRISIDNLYFKAVTNIEKVG